MCAKSLQSRPTLCDSVDCSPPGSSVHEIFQAKILKWVSLSYSRGSSPHRDQTHGSCISCIGRWILYHWHHLGSPYPQLKCAFLRPPVVGAGFSMTAQVDPPCKFWPGSPYATSCERKTNLQPYLGHSGTRVTRTCLLLRVECNPNRVGFPDDLSTVNISNRIMCPRGCGV